MKSALSAVFSLCSLVTVALPLPAADPPAPPAKVLVLTGQEYPGHPWKETAPLLAKFLAADPRLATTVNTDPKFLASPKLHDYDVIVLNYMNWQTPDPGEEARANLKKFVEGGKGLVLVHFACGAFQGWPEFQKIAGRVWDPKLRGHDPHGKFTVEIAAKEHPITRGMKPFETVDELYTCLAGDKEIQVLATANSKVDKKDYPITFVNRYGQGRVFHCVLGHDARALSGEGVQELYRRGTAWAAGLTLATAAEPKQAGGEKQITNSIGMKLTLIPAGEFKMGSGESTEATAAFFQKNYGIDFLTADLLQDEHPQHRVRITKPFYLGTCHVTRGQFRQFVKDSGYKTDAEKGERPGAYGWDPDKKEFGFNAKYSWRNAGFEQTDEHPVVNVSWNDAVAFCKWLSGKEGKTYRLPTEAEWEYACRAGTTTRYSSGDDPETLAKVGNVADAAAKAKFPDWTWTIKANDGYVFTAPVGSFKPNAFGLYDMHGNAWQWCADWYGEKYYAASPADDPTGPDTGDVRVLRGGSWGNWPNFTRSAVRYWIRPDFRDYLDSGFRVARTQ